MLQKLSVKRVLHRSAVTYLEYVPIEEHHDDARYVERGQGRVDDEIGVVKKTEVRRPVRRVVQPQHDGTANCRADGPHQHDCQPHAPVVFVLGVFYRLRDRDVPAKIAPRARQLPTINYERTSAIIVDERNDSRYYRVYSERYQIGNGWTLKNNPIPANES